MSESYTALGPPDAPAIVFVHGTRQSRGAWQPQLAALSGVFRVVALDLPGHGALADRPFRWDDAVAEIHRVIDEAAGGRAILVGLSPRRVPGDRRGRPRPGARRRARRRRAPRPTRAARSGSAVGLLEAALARIPGRLLDGVDRAFFRWRYPAVTAEAIVAGGFAHASAVEGLRQLRGRRFGPLLAAYPGPTLIVNGAYDPPFRLGADGFRRAARDARVVVLGRATHLVNLDRPSAFSALVARFAAEAVRGDRSAPGQTGSAPPTGAAIGPNGV